MKVLGLTDGSAGMVVQVRALADALGLQAEMRVISLPSSMRLLPNLAFDYLPFLYSLLPTLRNPKIPKPDLIISCGRKAALVAAAQRRAINRSSLREAESDEAIQKQKEKSWIATSAAPPRNDKLCKYIHIQDPQMRARNFDLVIAMEHDKITGENVIKTCFALHNITAEKLAIAREKFAPVFAEYPKPHIAVLLGGSTNKYNFTPSRMGEFIAELKAKLLANSDSLLITPSRRTGAENIAKLQAEFAGNNRVYIYDGISKNPYMGLLACADEIIVSNDSVNMMSEAFASEKVVTILPLAGHKNTKPARFAEMIKSAPKMTGDEMQKLAKEVRARLLF